MPILPNPHPSPTTTAHLPTRAIYAHQLRPGDVCIDESGALTVIIRPTNFLGGRQGIVAFTCHGINGYGHGGTRWGDSHWELAEEEPMLILDTDGR